MDRLLEVFLLPWKAIESYGVSAAAVIILAPLAVVLFLVGRIAARSLIKKWPPRRAMLFRIFSSFLLVSILGGFSNSIAILAGNKNKMPVVVAHDIVRSSDHFAANDDIGAIWFAGYIKTGNSRLARLLFPDKTIVSPGDLMIALGFLFCFWMTCSAFLYWSAPRLPGALRRLPYDSF